VSGLFVTGQWENSAMEMTPDATAIAVACRQAGALSRKQASAVGLSDGQIARPGKRGLGKLGAVLDERGPGHVPPQSELEGRLFEVLAHAGLPAPVRQFPLPGRGVVTGLTDAAYPDVRLILEADGRRWHTRIRDLRRDHLRDAEAARAGWQTLRFLYEEIVGDASYVAATEITHACQQSFPRLRVGEPTAPGCGR
jgi:hypothetical protein